MRTARVYQFDDRPAPTYSDMPLRSMRRARLYPIGTQAGHRGRMFYYRTAPVIPSTSEAETEFVIRARRRKPMTHTVTDDLWDVVPDPTIPPHLISGTVGTPMGLTLSLTVEIEGEIVVGGGNPWVVVTDPENDWS